MEKNANQRSATRWPSRFNSILLILKLFYVNYFEMTENKDLTSTTNINDDGEVETIKIHWDHKIPRKGLGM